MRRQAVRERHAICHRRFVRFGARKVIHQWWGSCTDQLVEDRLTRRADGWQLLLWLARWHAAYASRRKLAAAMMGIRAQRQQLIKGRKVEDASFARQILARGRDPVVVAGVRALADARVQLRRYACDPTVCLLLNAVASREAGLPLTPEQEAGLEHLGEILAAPDRRTAPPPRTETDLPVMRLDDAMQLHRMHEAGELQRIGSPGN